MHIKTEIRSDIFTYFLSEQNLLIYTRNHGYILNGKSLDEGETAYFGKNGEIFLTEKDKVKIIYNDNKAVTVPHKIGGLSISNKGGIFLSNSKINSSNNEFIHDFYYYDFKTKEERLILKEKSGYFALTYNNDQHLIFRSKKSLSSYSLSNFNEVWIQDFPFPITNIIGLCGNLIWLSFQTDYEEKYDCFFQSINAIDGLLSYTIRNKSALNAVCCVSNATNKSIVSLNNKLDQTYFIEINAETGEILKETELTELREKGFTLALSKTMTLYKNKLYITVATAGTLAGSGIAILNLDDLSIEEAFKVENRTGTIANAAQVNDTHLYILDTGGTLHIYTKE